MLLVGALGAGPISLINGSLSNVTNFCGVAKEVGLNGIITLDNTATQQMVFFNCFSAQAGIDRPTLDMNGVSADIMIRGYIGGLTITNMTANHKVSFDGSSATLELAASCTGGTINVGGMTELIDGSTGTTVNTTRLITTLSGGSGGLTPDQSAQLSEVWSLMGLDSDNPSTVTRTMRTVGDVEIKITRNGDGSVILTRL